MFTHSDSVHTGLTVRKLLCSVLGADVQKYRSLLTQGSPEGHDLMVVYLLFCSPGHTITTLMEFRERSI